MTCKVGKIPCWGGKEFIDPHYGNEGYNAVYEVNKQMCDMEKELTKNEDIMEEKKKKKMTKAEAFEYLKGKRVLCGAYSREIQDFAKSVGFNWSSCKDEYWLVLALFFGKDGRLTYTLSPKEFENHDDYEEISADDILSIEIVEEEKPSQEFVPHELTEMGKVQSTFRR